MKLATLKQGGRDGTLVVVSRDLKRCRAVPAIETDPELRALTTAIDSLSHAYKTPWLLRQCTLLSNQEIAEALTLRDEQVSQRLHRARQLIVAQLQQPSQPAAVSMEPVSIPA